MKKSNAPVKLLWNLTIRAPTLEEVRAAQKLKTPKKSRPKKPAWLLPEKLKSQAQIEREETERAYGPVERREWMKQQRCVVDSAGCRGAVEGHHVRNGGRGRKADARFIAPLCKYHHDVLHQHGKRTFEAATACHLETAAARTEIAWQEHRVKAGNP